MPADPARAALRECLRLLARSRVRAPYSWRAGFVPCDVLIMDARSREQAVEKAREALGMKAREKKPC